MIRALPNQYVADMKARGFGFQLQVNGVDVAEFADQNGERFSARLNVWLRHGRNSIVATFSPNPPGTAARSSQLQIMAFGPDGNPTAIFDSGETGGLQSRFEIEVQERTGSILEKLGGPEIARDFPEVLPDVIMELHRAFENRDFDRVVTLQRVQLEEKSVSVGMSLAHAIETYREFIEKLWTAPGWQIDRLDAVIKPAGLPGLIQALDRLGGPAISMSSNELRFAINPYLAKVQGSWTIVR